MFLFGVANYMENSSELAKRPELLRQEDLKILLVCELSPDLWHECPDIDSQFLTPFLVVKTYTSSKNLYLPEGTIFPELDKIGYKMLKKVSFVFIFTLESTDSSSC